MHPLQLLYKDQQSAIEQRLLDFQKITDAEDLFYELCFCLLTPQSQAHACDAGVKALRTRRFYQRPFRAATLLRSHTRFHRNKAHYLLLMHSLFPVFLTQRATLNDPFLLREWLVTHIMGLGYKEASHYLRNIGYRGLTILDRHILRNLQTYHVISSLPRTLTRKHYLRIEQQFFDFAQSLGISIDALDLLFWSKETGEIFK